MGYTNTGRQLLRDFLGGTSVKYPTHIAIGTDNTAASDSDTQLGDEVVRRAIDTYDPEDGTNYRINYIFNISSVEQNGVDLKEAGVFDESTAGDMFARTTFATISKNNTIDIQFTLTFEIE
jgi:hypothetical protein